MTSEILIAMGGLLLSVLTYFAGVWRTEKRHDKEDKSARIEAVFNRYMEYRRTNGTGGLDGLLKSGAATLNDDKEIREVVEIIIAHGEKTPIGRGNELQNIDLKKLFEYVAKNEISFLRTQLEEIIEKINA